MASSTQLAVLIRKHIRVCVRVFLWFPYGSEIEVGSEPPLCLLVFEEVESYRILQEPVVGRHIIGRHRWCGGRVGHPLE